MELKIAILGTRGIPNNYGGFEHIAGHLAAGLVKKGHDVYVYSSSKHPYQKKSWNGVNIIHCFDPEYLIGVPGQFIYDLNCILDARKKNYDIILMLGYTSSSVWGFLYPENSIVITNMDGMEWKRAKYSPLVRKFLRVAEKLAVLTSRYHIADSPIIKDYLDNQYHIDCRYIAYGAVSHKVMDTAVLKEYGLHSNGYFMLMARMEPENNIEMILDGYCLSKQDKPFLVVGNMSNQYGKKILAKYRNEPGIIFAGPVFDEQKVATLTTSSCLYFHGHSVGGTNPSLLAAMAMCAPLAIHDNLFNKSIVGENALRFNNVTDVQVLLGLGEFANRNHIEKNFLRVAQEFSWEKITDQYEHYFLDCWYAEKYAFTLNYERNILYKR